MRSPPTLLALLTLLALAGAALAQPTTQTENGEPLEAADDQEDDGTVESIQEDPSGPSWTSGVFLIAPFGLLALAGLMYAFMRRARRSNR